MVLGALRGGVVMLLSPPELVGAPTLNSACSFGWWLMAGAGLFREKNTVGWLLVADLF
jgi:hypothetical protein